MAAVIYGSHALQLDVLVLEGKCDTVVVAAGQKWTCIMVRYAQTGTWL
jgi:hypothetical protein